MVKRRRVLFGCAVGVTVLAVTLTFVAPAVLLHILVNTIAQQHMVHQGNTKEVGDWSNGSHVGAPTTLHYFKLFNYTNVEQLAMLPSITVPRVEERGPYVFQESVQEYNLSFISSDDGRAAIQYSEYSQYTFRPELSNGTLDDLIYTPWNTYLATLTSTGGPIKIVPAIAGKAVYAVITLFAEVLQDAAPGLAKGAALNASIRQWAFLGGAPAVGLDKGTSIAEHGAIVASIAAKNRIVGGNLQKLAFEQQERPEFRAYLIHNGLSDFTLTDDQAIGLFLGTAGFSCPLAGTAADGTPCAALLFEFLETGDPRMHEVFPLTQGTLEELATYLVEYTTFALLDLLKWQANVYEPLTPLWVRRTPHQLLFDFEDPLLLLLGYHRNGAYFDSFDSPDAAWPHDKGYIQDRSGVGDPNRASEYLAFMGKKVLPSVEEDKEHGVWCGTEMVVQGHDTSQFPMAKPSGIFSLEPRLTTASRITLWVETLIQSIDFVVESTYKYRGVIDVLRFTIAEDFYRPNASMSQSIYGCVDMSCPEGAPVLMSLPRFYNAASNLSKPHGMLPIAREDAVTFIDVDPITGFALSGDERLQLSLMASHGVKSGNIVLPVLWDSKQVHMTDKEFAAYKSTVLPAVRMLHLLPIGLGALSAVLVVVCIAAAVFLARAERRDRDLRDDSPEPESLEPLIN